ncbi:MAG: SH3 domain-containing protein [Eubacteriales bacterium]|nr:SH3 domain-containing protein [Eubacteriales bacterium]
MKKMKFVTLTVTALSLAFGMIASAMPADIEEAVTSSDYNAYAAQNNYAWYDDSDLIQIGGYYIATADAMIRQAPFGTIIGSVTPGQSYYVVGECSDCFWYKISGPVSGYVYASYMVPGYEYNESTNSNSDIQYNIRSLDMEMIVKDAPSVNVRTAPSTSGSIIGVVSEGQEVHVTGNVLNTEWYQCIYNNQTAYICDDYLAPELPQTMGCTISMLNIRSYASINGQIIGTLNKGDKVRVTADEDGWLRFSMDNGTIGYVSDEYMAAIE